MTTTLEHDAKIATLTFASVYPHYVQKVTKKGRTEAELQAVIEWLTGFDNTAQQQLIKENVNFATFFERANMHPNANLIKGTICGYRVEDITTPITQKIRYLDKVVDELAKGKALEKIKRK